MCVCVCVTLVRTRVCASVFPCAVCVSIVALQSHVPSVGHFHRSPGVPRVLHFHSDPLPDFPHLPILGFLSWWCWTSRSRSSHFGETPICAHFAARRHMCTTLTQSPSSPSQGRSQTTHSPCCPIPREGDSRGLATANDVSGEGHCAMQALGGRGKCAKYTAHRKG